MKGFFIKPFSYYSINNEKYKKQFNILRDPATYLIVALSFLIGYLVNLIY